MTRKKSTNAANGAAGNGAVKPASPARQVRTQNSNSNSSSNHSNSNGTSSNNNRRQLTEQELDEKLRAMGLVRKAIPKDGACLFRATSEQLHSTQNYHLDLRRACVAFLRSHKEDFEPFVCTDGIPYDHYCYEMGKPDCWAGQVELQALSLHYKVNFLIYSEQPKPTIIDNGFDRVITLCFLGGNHYDCVYKESTFNVATFAQELVYEMASRAVGDKVPEGTGPYTYKNVGLMCYLQNLREQRDKDKKIAEELSGDGSNLSGFYRKEDGSHERGWEKKLSRRSKKEKNKIKLELEFGLTPEEAKESKQLKEDLEKIAQLEKQEVVERILTDHELFPALAKPPAAKEKVNEIHPQTNGHVETSSSTPANGPVGEEKKGMVWGGQNIVKNLFAAPPQPDIASSSSQPGNANAKKSNRRAKKAAERQARKAAISPEAVITGLVNVDDRAASGITFGSITPSSPHVSRHSAPADSSSSTTSTTSTTSTSTSTPSQTTSSPAESTTTTPSTASSPIESQPETQKIGHLEAISIELPDEDWQVPIVFGDFPPQSMDEIPTLSNVSIPIPSPPKNRTKRKEDETKGDQETKTDATVEEIKDQHTSNDDSTSSSTNHVEAMDGHSNGPMAEKESFGAPMKLTHQPAPSDQGHFNPPYPNGRHAPPPPGHEIPYPVGMHGYYMYPGYPPPYVYPHAYYPPPPSQEFHALEGAPPPMYLPPPPHHPAHAHPHSHPHQRPAFVYPPYYVPMAPYGMEGEPNPNWRPHPAPYMMVPVMARPPHEVLAPSSPPSVEPFPATENGSGPVTKTATKGTTSTPQE